MPVPDFQTFMLPVLREFADGAEHVYKNVRERVAAALRLSPEDLADRILSGKKTRVDDRASCAQCKMLAIVGLRLDRRPSRKANKYLECHRKTVFWDGIRKT